MSAPFPTEGTSLRTVDLDLNNSMTLSENPYFNDNQQSVNFVHNNVMPIVFDTGASASVSPLREDFIGLLDPPLFPTLKGLKYTIKVVGSGMLEWTIIDVDGIARTMSTNTLYITDGSIRFFSPQTYFQENHKGKAPVDEENLNLTLPCGTTMRFRYTSGCNLPIMLTKHVNGLFIGLSFEDIQVMSESASVYLTVADETNQNLISSQKELLLWHWRLGHANFQWIQMMCASPRDPSVSSLLTTNQSNVSCCILPLCMACQLTKQAQRTPDGTTSKFDTTKEMLTKKEHLIPGQIISVDQYMGSTPGRLPLLKGKESKKDKYTGGTIFVDHASGFVLFKIKSLSVQEQHWFLKTHLKR
jgi:hypothetical protein